MNPTFPAPSTAAARSRAQAPAPYAPTHALEGHLALRLTAGLSERAADLPHPVAERLRVAREHALARARQRAAASPVGRAGPNARSAESGLAPHATLWWQRLASALPLALLAAGLVFISTHQDREQVELAAQIDSELLADELPPQAYRDPGFSEFLQRQSGS